MHIIDDKKFDWLRITQYGDGDVRVVVLAERNEHTGNWNLRIEEANVKTGVAKVVQKHVGLTSVQVATRFDRICDLIRTDGRFWMRR